MTKNKKIVDGVCTKCGAFLFNEPYAVERHYEKEHNINVRGWDVDYKKHFVLLREEAIPLSDHEAEIEKLKQGYKEVGFTDEMIATLSLFEDKKLFPTVYSLVKSKDKQIQKAKQDEREELKQLMIKEAKKCMLNKKYTFKRAFDEVFYKFIGEQLKAKEGKKDENKN